jgi:hypothetical protein
MDVGSVDGEDVERLWSRIGNLTNIVRQCTKAVRLEQIEDALADFYLNKICNLSHNLLKRFKRANQEIRKWDGIRPSLISRQVANTEISGADVWVAKIAHLKRSMRHVKKDAGQKYAAKLSRSINSAKKKLADLERQGIMPTYSQEGLEDLLFGNSTLLYSKAEKELVLVKQELKRHKLFLEENIRRLNECDEADLVITKKQLFYYEKSLKTLEKCNDESVDSSSSESSDEEVDEEDEIIEE